MPSARKYTPRPPMRAILDPMRVIFMGSPDFALPALRKLIDSEHEVVAVFTQPDRPSGRGRKLAPPPVKTLALAHGLTVLQPRRISKPEIVAQIRDMAPDLGVIAAYGQILKQPVLDATRLGVLNVHASLLPRWRGAAPIPAAILAGDAETGATIMQVELALDAGPMLGRVRMPIASDDTTATLTPRIAEAGSALLMELLHQYALGALTPVPQDDTQATYAPQLEKADALIRWDRDDAQHIARMVRAYNPWPIAYSYLDGAPLRILRAIALAEQFPADAHAPGTIIATNADMRALSLADVAFAIMTVDGAVGVTEVQPPGGKAMSAANYLNGHRHIIGKQLTSD